MQESNQLLHTKISNNMNKNPDFTIYLGTKNISSWSLRAWLMLKLCDIPFHETVIELEKANTREKILAVSPSGKIPLLKHNEQFVWDSLAIGEYLNDVFPEKQLWPSDISQRAEARSISCEMHAGFLALRTHLPFTISKKIILTDIPGDAQNDIHRIITIWENCRNRFGHLGPFLFGKPTIADAMYAPVVSRFHSYGIALPAVAKKYAETIMDWEPMKIWIKSAQCSPL